MFILQFHERQAGDAAHAVDMAFTGPAPGKFARAEAFDCTATATGLWIGQWSTRETH
jgi:hypothetical protein